MVSYANMPQETQKIKKQEERKHKNSKEDKKIRY